MVLKHQKKFETKTFHHGRAQGITNGLRGRKRSLRGRDKGTRNRGMARQNPLWNLVDVPCFTSDYFPTIANILGIDPQKYQRPYDGENLIPYWTKKRLKRTKPLAFQFNKQFALIDNDHKLYGISQGVNNYMILGQDAREENDLSSLQPEKLKALQRLYRDWNLSVQNSNAGGIINFDLTYKNITKTTG